MQPQKYKFYLKFYATTTRVTNHLFKWRVNSRERAFKGIKHFEAMGWQITAAYFEKCSNEGTMLSNEQIYSSKKTDYTWRKYETKRSA